MSYQTVRGLQLITRFILPEAVQEQSGIRPSSDMFCIVETTLVAFSISMSIWCNFLLEKSV